MNPIHRFSPVNGFSLVELMLSLSLGLGLSGVMLQGLMAEGQNGARLSRLLRERAAQRRTLELIKGDLAQSTAVSTTPTLEQHACSLAGRSPVLHLSTAAGSITYSVGAAPSAIWRAQVLMRCGPAYGLDGALSSGSQSLNRVVMDGLVATSQMWRGCGPLLEADQNAVVDLSNPSGLGFAACLHGQTGVLGLRLEQAFTQVAGRPTQTITHSALVESLPLSGYVTGL